MRTHHFALPLPLILALAVASPRVAYADGQTLQLGSISVTGDQKIIETLRSIKQALRAPYTDFRDRRLLSLRRVTNLDQIDVNGADKFSLQR